MEQRASGTGKTQIKVDLIHFNKCNLSFLNCQLYKILWIHYLF
jgi:hypothetical protein